MLFTQGFSKRSLGGASEQTSSRRSLFVYARGMYCTFPFDYGDLCRIAQPRYLDIIDHPTNDYGEAHGAHGGISFWIFASLSFRLFATPPPPRQEDQNKVAQPFGPSVSHSGLPLQVVESLSDFIYFSRPSSSSSSPS